MMTALVQFQNVTKKYSSKKALDNVSFTLEPGKIYGLLGPNNPLPLKLSTICCSLHPARFW